MTKLLLIILRNIFRERLKFLILVVSLAVGLCGFTLVLLVVSKELSYDKFHNNYENIYRVVTVTENESENVQIPMAYGALKEYLEGSVSSLQSVTHFIPVYYGMKVKSNNEYFVENSGVYVDDSFNDVFDFRIIAGDRNTMFSQVNSIALTRDLSLKYFSSIDVIGRELAIDDGWGLRTVLITGIYEQVPDNSSLKFDFLLTGRSYGNWTRLLERKALLFFTYMKFKDQLDEISKDFIESNLHNRLTDLNNLNKNVKSQYLQPIQKIHLSTDIRNDLSGKIEPNQIYILWFTAVSILILTSINFININTIQVSSKIKFLGMLKILGHKNPISRILIIDSIIKCLTALSIAFILVTFIGKSIFGEIFGNRLHLTSHVVFILVMICIAIGLVAGLIPAMLLSGRRPLDLVKGKSLMALGKYPMLKLTSMTIQFFIVIVLMIVTTVVIKQIDYIDSLDMGYDKSERMLIPAPQGIGGNYLGFVNAARDLSYIRWIGTSMFSFYSDYREGSMKINRVDYNLMYNLVDKDYLSSMGIEIKEGKNFSGIYTADTVSAILNETAARSLSGGSNRSILNSIITVNLPWYSNKEFRIIGIMKDFHFKSLKSRIEPLVFFYLPRDATGATTLVFETNQSENLKEHLSVLWKENGIETPFEFELLEDAFAETHKDQNLLGSISKSFTMLAFFLALFGLFAYLKHSLEFKKREFAIRRVLGATPLNIYYNLNREMLTFFTVSTIIALPVAYYAGLRWLSQFAYHTNLDLNTFLIPISLTLAVVILIGVYLLQDMFSEKTTEILKVE
ncbi:MAG: FtsX-like permease family protein [Bacteroidetes bacterium]|nr:MAG: FtsX-like permease family protein [Bacteroidota bacterium]